MPAARLRQKARSVSASQPPQPLRRDERLAGLSNLAVVDIELPLVANLSGELHALFDPVSEGALPIYFGPLLGRLYLEGL